MRCLKQDVVLLKCENELPRRSPEVVQDSAVLEAATPSIYDERLLEVFEQQCIGLVTSDAQRLEASGGTEVFGLKHSCPENAQESAAVCDEACGRFALQGEEKRAVPSPLMVFPGSRRLDLASFSTDVLRWSR